MRLLRNIVLIVLPILLMVNIYNWIFTSSSGGEWVAQSNFKGFSYIHQYMTTFPGIDTTLTIINDIQENATAFNDIEIHNLLDLLTAISSLVELIGEAFSIPIMIIVDLVRDLYWFISVLFIQK